MAPKEFAIHFGGEVQEHLDPTVPVADLERLHDKSKVVVGYVDRHLAHHDLKPLKVLPTYEDLNEAIDEIGKLFNKYTLLLTQSSWGQLEPVIQGHWTEIFEHPWIIVPEREAI